MPVACSRKAWMRSGPCSASGSGRKVGLHLARKLQLGAALGLLHGACPGFLLRLPATKCHGNQRAEGHEDAHVLCAEPGAVIRIHGLHDTAARCAIHEWNSQKCLGRQPGVCSDGLVVLGVLRGVRRVYGLEGFKDPARDALALGRRHGPSFRQSRWVLWMKKIAACFIR